MLWLFNLLILIQFNQTGNSIAPEDFVWKNRLVIVHGECDCSEWFKEKLQSELSERKLLVVHFKKEGLTESNFKGELKRTDFLKLLPKRDNQTITWALVGLDGGVKNSGTTNPKPNDIFRIIDAMPMRQSELVKKENQDNSLNK